MTHYDLLNKLAPTFILRDDTNQTRTLHTLMGEKGLLLVFVYGTYCPTCMETYMKLTKEHGNFQQRGINIAMVALDKWIISHTFKLSMKPQIPFTILSDEDGAIHKAYDMYTWKSGHVLINPAGVVLDMMRNNQYPGTANLLEMVDTHLDHTPA